MTTPSNDWWDVPLPPPRRSAPVRRRRRRRRRARQRGRLGRRSRSLRHRRRASRRDAVRRATRAPGAGPEQPRVRPLVRRVPHLLPPPSPSPSSPPSPPATCACAWGCGERYCDERCRDEHARRGHRVLCVGPLDSWEHPIAALKLEAAQDEHGDGVLALVVEACARCLSAGVLIPSSSPSPRTRRSTRSSPQIFTGSCAGRGGNTAAVDVAVRSRALRAIRRPRRVGARGGGEGPLSRRSEPFGAATATAGVWRARGGSANSRLSPRETGVRGGRIHGFVPGPRPGFELARG